MLQLFETYRGFHVFGSLNEVFLTNNHVCLFFFGLLAVRPRLIIFLDVSLCRLHDRP